VTELRSWQSTMDMKTRREYERQMKAQLEKKITDQYDDAMRLYFKAEDDLAVQQSLIEVEELQTGPFKDSRRIIQKIEDEKTGKGVKIKTEPIKQAWLSETLRRIHTVRPRRVYEDAIRAAEQIKDELDAVKKANKGTSKTISRGESKIEKASKKLEKTKVSAEEAIAVASKKEKDAVQEEWDTKIAQAEGCLASLQSELAEAQQEAEAELVKIASLTATFDVASKKEERESKVVQEAKDAAEAKFKAIEKKRHKPSESRRGRPVSKESMRTRSSDSPKLRINIEGDCSHSETLIMKSPTNDKTRLDQLLFSIRINSKIDSMMDSPQSRPMTQRLPASSPSPVGFRQRPKSAMPALGSRSRPKISA